MEWFWLILIISIPTAIFNKRIRKKLGNKKTSIISLIVGLIMTTLAITFTIFAINHPNLSYPWPNSITYIIYGIYIISNFLMYIISYNFLKEGSEII